MDVGGYRLAFQEAGTGRPTVVLEAGAGLAAATWDPLWAPLARLTRVVRYDRAGLGRSEAAPAPLTHRDQVAVLHTLLQRAAISGPYVLVGHSLGGLLVRMYAEHYPVEVVGLVLVDAVHPEQNRRALELLPPERPDESAALATLRRNLRRVNDETTSWIENMGEYLNWSASQAEARALGPLGALPLVVVTQGGPVETNLPPDCPADFAAYAARSYHPMAMALQADLARLSSRSRQIIAARSGHMIHRDEPEVVIAAIREMVEAARQGEQH